MKQQQFAVAFTALLLLFSLTNYAQSIVRGTVTDQQGTPVAGASVQLKNRTIGTSTDLSGAFRLSLPNGNGTLVFSSIGFATEEVNIKNQTNISVRLSATANMQNEVVVIGYGTQKKSDLTGAVSSIKARDFNNGVNTSPEQLFIGKAAGVRGVQSGGEPGAGLSISIRAQVPLLQVPNHFML